MVHSAPWRGRETFQLRESAGEDCAGLHRRVKDSVAAFAAGTPQRDDMTLMVVEYRGR